MTYPIYREVIDEETEVKIASQFCFNEGDCQEDNCRCPIEE